MSKKKTSQKIWAVVYKETGRIDTVRPSRDLARFYKDREQKVVRCTVKLD